MLHHQLPAPALQVEVRYQPRRIQGIEAARMTRGIGRPSESPLDTVTTLLGALVIETPVRTAAGEVTAE
jgi:hypothetical protein